VILIGVFSLASAARVYVTSMLSSALEFGTALAIAVSAPPAAGAENTPVLIWS
jgi:hypothetical protein